MCTVWLKAQRESEYKIRFVKRNVLAERCLLESANSYYEKNNLIEGEI